MKKMLKVVFATNFFFRPCRIPGTLQYESATQPKPLEALATVLIAMQYTFPRVVTIVYCPKRNESNGSPVSYRVLATGRNC